MSYYKLTEEEVLKIVDSCFHMYASHYRTDARDCAREIMKGMINKALQQANSANTENEVTEALPLYSFVQRELLFAYVKTMYELENDVSIYKRVDSYLIHYSKL